MSKNGIMIVAAAGLVAALLLAVRLWPESSPMGQWGSVNGQVADALAGVAGHSDVQNRTDAAKPNAGMADIRDRAGDAHANDSGNSNGGAQENSNPVVAESQEEKEGIDEPLKYETVDNRININSADEIELMKLKGVGSVKAKAIVEYRRVNGSFKSVDQLMKVKGIGPKTFEKLKADIKTGD